MKNDKFKFLVLSEDNGLPKRIRKLFNDKKFQISHETDLSVLEDRFTSDTYQLVLLTSSVCRDKEEHVSNVLDEITSNSPATQVVFLVDAKHIDVAISALKLGTYQYAKLPVSDEELQLLLQAALEMRPTIHADSGGKQRRGEERFEQLVGSSEPMQHVYQQIEQAAATDIPVLIVGETGTGKDLTAQAIHRRSSRRDGPYIPVNLGALPPDLIASELFGHDKGAFTGATNQHKGKFEQGENGTVFLDEIDTVEEKVQVSLLRLIEQKKFHRLGGRRAVKTNARLITASNENLEKLVRNGSFREDLFYRLDVFRIVMPPLRQRRGDISLLITEFLARYNQSLNKNVRRISPEASRLLEGYDWPGNVRELKNVIQRAVLVCEGDVILPKHLTARFQEKKPRTSVVEFEIGTPLEEVEREMIVRALSLAENNRKRAAELLGISRRAIYNKLRKHNIE